MKINKWTAGLAAVGLVSLASVTQAEEQSVPLMTALSSTIISGYVDTSAVWNPGTGNANPAPVSFNAGKQDGFNLNVVNLTLEKPIDETQWSAGYKVELLFGPDAVGYNPSANARTSSNAVDENGDPAVVTSNSDFSIKQAYVAVRAPVGNGLDLKMGVFDTPIGYESFVGYRNPNYTRSYGYTLEPTQHTGILASYQFCEILSASAGVANTLSAGINTRSPRAESAKTYMGSITITAPESAGVLAGSALYAGIVDGFAGGSNEDQTSVYVGATIATPVAGLRLGASYDQAFHLGGKENAGYADAVAAYVSFQATEKMSIHLRGEYAKGNLLSAPGGEKIVAVTGTLQYDLWQNVISRLEVRWDHSASGTEIFGGTSDPTKKNEVMVAANLVYRF
ncbi:MAG: outer membrane beta-barrel protein [Verrucomicrobiota bacterium]